MTESLDASLDVLTRITNETHTARIRSVANAIWEHDLTLANPLWSVVRAEPFVIDDAGGRAHAIAIVDGRLPGIGIVGYFGCTDAGSGARVLEEAWR